MCCVKGGEVSRFGGVNCFGVGGVGKRGLFLGVCLGAVAGVCGVGRSGGLVFVWGVSVGVCV